MMIGDQDHPLNKLPRYNKEVSEPEEPLSPGDRWQAGSSWKQVKEHLAIWIHFVCTH